MGILVIYGVVSVSVKLVVLVLMFRNVLLGVLVGMCVVLGIRILVVIMLC